MDYKQARKILKKYDRQIIRDTADCVGTSIRYEAGRWRMRVFVKKIRDSHQELAKITFSEKEAKLKDVDIKGPQEELSVEVVETGEFEAFAARTSKWRPAPGGVSIGHYQITAGTLGSLAYKSNGTKYILSNNHVLANCNDAEVGDDIYQPGPYDGGTVADKIGELAEFVTLTFNDPDNPNVVDCALCLPTNAADADISIIGVEYPYEIKEAEIGEEVIKSGRTSGITEGVIGEFSGLIGINYGAAGVGWFDDQIITGTLPNMGRPGDSGSLLISKETGDAVGLLFAGSSILTIFNRMTDVAAALAITVRDIRAVTAQASIALSNSTVVLKGDLEAGTAQGAITLTPICDRSKSYDASKSAASAITITASSTGEAITPVAAASGAGITLTPFTTCLGYQLYGPNQAGGLYRIADDALDRYELYLGIDAEPDLDAAPYKTFTSLPHVINLISFFRLFGKIDGILDRKDFGPLQIPPFVLLDAAESATYYFVLRKRNKWGLISQNIKSWSVVIDGFGDIIAPNPSAPSNVTITPATGGKGLVEAQYLYDLDDDYPATHWLIYFTDTGVDPDPDVDTPTVVAMYKSGGIAHLIWLSAAADNNDTLKVLVRARRVSGSNYDSDNTDIHSCTAVTEGPAAAPGRAFYGHSAEAM